MDNKELRITLEGLKNVLNKCPETAQYIEENLKELCEREHISVQEGFHFVVLFFRGSLLIDCLLFHGLAVFSESRQME